MPSLAGDAQFREWWARAGSEGASPAAARQQYEPLFSLDLRDQLRRIAVPTLVLQSPETWIFHPQFGAYLADHIAGARLVELESADRLLFGANARVALDEIEEFLTGSRLGATRDRILVTLLFTDICGSTATAATLGDERWRSRLDVHDEIVRGQLRRHGAREVNTLGDGFLAAFDSVASAIYCARAICQTAAAAGIDVRSGVHSGECEQRGADVAGMAVHIAARVAALGAAGDVLVSRTVRDLVVGSELRFTPRGEHVLKGVPESWQIYALDDPHP
jgi:class 3 adenylate cyclase